MGRIRPSRWTRNEEIESIVVTKVVYDTNFEEFNTTLIPKLDMHFDFLKSIREILKLKLIQVRSSFENNKDNN